FVVQIAAPGGVNLTNYNFGERGLESSYVTILEFLASTPTDGGYASVSASGESLWTTQLNGYADVKFSEFVLSTDRSKALLTIVDDMDRVFTAELSADQLNYQQHSTNETFLVRFNGNQQSHNFQPVNINTAPARADVPTYLDSVDDYFAQF